VFRQLLATGELDYLIVDSVASMVTENELNADTGKAVLADRAKMMHQFMRQISGTLHQAEVPAIFLNHMLDVVDITPMGQKLAGQGIKRKTTAGGMALKFYASMRIEFKQLGNVRSSVLDPLTNELVDDIRQTKIQATCVKNKVGIPYRQAELRVRYGLGFSQAYSVLNILTAHKIVKKGGAGMFTFPADLAPTADAEPFTLRGEESVIQALEGDSEWLGRLAKVAQAKLIESEIPSVDATLYDENGDLIETKDEPDGY
jgi:recombination protein RecA